MSYRQYIESQGRGRKLVLAIKSALKALDSRDISKCQEWLTMSRKGEI